LATKHAIRNTLARALLHRRWWLNDTDCLMVRDTKTELTINEVLSLATVIAVTDGMIVLSDRVERLSEERRRILQRTLPLAGGRAEVVDLMYADIPELVVARSLERTVVAVFNFADEARRKQVDLQALRVPTDGVDSVTEWWSGTSVAIASGRADLGEIPPHGCRVLMFPCGS
jgi:alpha-galactosidase